MAGRQHGRVLYLYLPTFFVLGCLALAGTYSDETTAPDGIMPQFETSKGDPAVSNQASRLEIYREGTSMAGASRCLSVFSQIAVLTVMQLGRGPTNLCFQHGSDFSSSRRGAITHWQGRTRKASTYLRHGETRP